MILFTHDFKKEMQKLNGVTACMLQSPNFCLDTVGGFQTKYIPLKMEKMVQLGIAG